MKKPYPYKAICFIGRDIEEQLPVVGLQLVDSDGDVHDTVVSPFEARHLGYMLISMASEVESQESYITALRSRKEDELEIIDIMKEAAAFLQHKRSLTQ